MCACFLFGRRRFSAEQVFVLRNILNHFLSLALHLGSIVVYLCRTQRVPVESFQMIVHQPNASNAELSPHADWVFKFP